MEIEFFCPFTQKNCREDCALFQKYARSDEHQCSFYKNAEMIETIAYLILQKD